MEHGQPVSCWPPEDREDDAAVAPAPREPAVAPAAREPAFPTRKRRRADEDEDEDDDDLETLALVFLARRLRRHQQKNAAAAATAPPGSSPFDRLFAFAQTERGRELLARRLERLLSELRVAPLDAALHVSAASVLDLLGRPGVALEHAQRGKDEWLVAKLSLQIAADSAVQAPLPAAAQKPCFWTPLAVPRVQAGDLSLPDFLDHYARARRPVVLCGLACTTVPWTLEHVAATAAGIRFTSRRLVHGSSSWAQLEPGRETTVDAFVRDVESGLEREHYLFDWSLPLGCPALAEQLIIPKYFANDFLQRMPRGAMYRDSWPSLFIAPAGVRSELHIDTFGSNFWMALFQVRKRWTLFAPESTPYLYPHYGQSTDPSFRVDLAVPDTQAFPWLQHAQAFVTDLQPGEVLFVPAGCAHRVENLDVSLAVSANFIDDSNLRLALEALRTAGLRDDRAANLHEQLAAASLTMDLDRDHTLYKDFHGDGNDDHG